MNQPATHPAKVDSKPPRTSAWGPWRIFWLALAVRLMVIGLGHYYNLRPQQDHFDFGAEMGRVARALVTGRGYSDPFLTQSGPTAWLTPLFPLILSGVFKCFGVYSRLSAWAILSFDSLLNALMIPLIWEMGVRCFNQRTARWSAWIWALYPAAMQYAVKWVWEMTLTTFLLQVALVLALRTGSVGNCASGSPQCPDGPTWRRWLGFGLVWGLIALSNAGTLLFLPVCGLWMLARSGNTGLKHLPKAVCSGLVFFAVVAPWSWRNQQVFHTFVPFRTNFGAELYLGNGPGANGFLMQYEHPTVSVQQFELYKQMGELRYSQWRGAEAKAAIRADLPHFFRLCLTRVYFYWFGVTNPGSRLMNDLGRGLNFGFASCAGLIGVCLALRRRIPGVGLMAAAFLLLPAAYYLIEVHARFRHPLEPLITLLSVWLFQQAQLRWGFTLPVLRGLWPARRAQADASAKA
jgi:4-amino-4-deoxy-L-arabinose transferase-like glycosyltransferase